MRPFTPIRPVSALQPPAAAPAERRRLRLLPYMAAILASALATGCPLTEPEFEPPDPDDCSSPRALSGVDRFEVGLLARPVDTDTRVFMPWVDDAVVDITPGLQGADMLGVALRLEGDEVPACVPHRLELYADDGAFLTFTEYPVNTYEESARGARRTDTIWMIFEGPSPYPGDTVELVARVGGFELRRRLRIEVPLPLAMKPENGVAIRASSIIPIRIEFDRYVYDGTVIELESSDPDLIQPRTSPLVVENANRSDTLAVRALFETGSTGGPVTIRATANGRTIEAALTVQD